MKHASVKKKKNTGRWFSQLGLLKVFICGWSHFDDGEAKNSV